MLVTLPYALADYLLLLEGARKVLMGWQLVKFFEAVWL